MPSARSVLLAHPSVLAAMFETLRIALERCGRGALAAPGIRFLNDFVPRGGEIGQGLLGSERGCPLRP